MTHQLTRVNELNGDFSEAHAYDGLDRLISSSRGTLGGGSFPNYSGIIAVGNGSQSWSLDQLGNWAGSWQDADGDGVVDEGEDQTRTANAANEIGAIAGRDAAEPVYDAAGNMTFDGCQHYVYDAWNRMVAAYQDDVVAQPPPAVAEHLAGALIASYEYDGRGYRVAKAVALYADAEHPAAVTGYDRTDFFYNESWQAVEQRLAANCPSPVGGGQGERATTDYVWDVSYIDTPVLRIRTAGESSESLYYTTDANKNVTAVVDPTDGSAVERYVYSPYGHATTYSDNWSSTVTWANSQQNDRQYCGYVLDAETALNCVRHRYYDSSMGAWTTRDPAGYADGMSLAAYVAGQVTTGIDPVGLGLLDWSDPRNYVPAPEPARQPSNGADEVAPTSFEGFRLPDPLAMPSPATWFPAAPSMPLGGPGIVGSGLPSSPEGVARLLVESLGSHSLAPGDSNVGMGSPWLVPLSSSSSMSDLQSWTLGGGYGAVRAIAGKTAFRINGTDFYVTGRANEAMWGQRAHGKSTSVLFIAKKADPRKLYRLDYDVLKKGPQAGQVGWEHNQTGVGQVLELKVANHQPAGRLGRLAGRSITLFKWGGRALFVASVVEGGIEIYHAEKRLRETVVQGGKLAGAAIGAAAWGQAGAEAGAWAGPWGAVIGAFGGAVLGGGLGAWEGGKITGYVYDFVTDKLEAEEWVVVCDGEANDTNVP